MGGGGSSLFSLAEKGNEDTLSSRLAQMASAGTLQLEEKHHDFGYTLLHFAAREGHVGCGRLLLQYGASATSQNNYGYTPLHLCALWNRVEFGKLLIENGADLDAADEQGDRPLHIAVREDHVSFARVLLESGADFLLKEGLGFLPLHFSKSEAMEDVLVEYYKEGSELQQTPARSTGEGGEDKPISFSELEEKMGSGSKASFSTPEVVLDVDGDDVDDGIKPDDDYDPNFITSPEPVPLQGDVVPTTTPAEQHGGLFFVPISSNERKRRMSDQVNEQMAAATLSSSGSHSPLRRQSSSPRVPPKQEIYASPLSGSSDGSSPRRSPTQTTPRRGSGKVPLAAPSPLGPQALGGMHDDDAGL